MKERALDSEISNRSILASGLEVMNESSIAELPNSIQSNEQSIAPNPAHAIFDNSTTAGEVLVPEKYKLTSKEK